MPWAAFHSSSQADITINLCGKNKRKKGLFLAVVGWMGRWLTDPPLQVQQLQLSRAEQVRPENPLPLVLRSALTEMLQDWALCLTRGNICPQGGCEDTQTRSLVPSPACSDTCTIPVSSEATRRAPMPLNSCSCACR